MTRTDELSMEDSRLLSDGKTLLTSIPGSILEEQYILENGNYLALTTDDCPHEEVLHILLVGQNRKLLDRIDIGQEYQSGILKNIKVIDPTTLEFDFINSQTFRLKLLSERKRIVKNGFFNSLIHYHNKFSKKYMYVETMVK